LRAIVDPGTELSERCRVEKSMSKAIGSINTNRYLVVAAFGLFFLVFYPDYPELVDKWSKSSDDSHGFLVPLISTYLIWQLRDALRAEEWRSFGWGLVILIASMLIYVVSFAGAIAVISRAMIVCGLVGLILYVFGRRIFSIVAFPVCFLLFMIPVPDSIHQLLAFPLQLFASWVSAALIDVIGIPVLREGNMLYFVQTQLEVAEACSGLRSMMSFIMLSCLFAYMMKGNWWKRLVIFFSAIPLALLANIVRVTGTGILSHFIGGKAAQGFLHDFSGLAVFVFGFVLLLIEFQVLERLEPGRDRQPTGTGADISPTSGDG